MESTRANFLFSRCCRATAPFLQPARGVYTAKAAREPPHILAQLLRPALHCLRAGFHKVGRLLMKPRPREAPRISCSRGYSYDCCKQRRAIINVRKRGYFLPSTLSSLFLSPSLSSPGISIDAKLGNGHHSAPPAIIEDPIRDNVFYKIRRRIKFTTYVHLSMILALTMEKLNTIYMIKIANIPLLSSTF